MCQEVKKTCSCGQKDTTFHLRDNVMGQEVAHERVTGESLMSIKISDGMGYYLVKVQNGDTLTTEKVFIR